MRLLEHPLHPDLPRSVFLQILVFQLYWLLLGRLRLGAENSLNRYVLSLTFSFNTPTPYSTSPNRRRQSKFAFRFNPGRHEEDRMKEHGFDGEFEFRFGG